MRLQAAETQSFPATDRCVVSCALCSMLPSGRAAAASSEKQDQREKAGLSKEERRARFRKAVHIYDAQGELCLFLVSTAALRQLCAGEDMETEMIESAMQKMSQLLQIGFGEAGNAIISKSLMGTGELNAMLPGQHVTAVFGFCDIRKFGEMTDVLRGQVMPFVNCLARIVHNHVAFHEGYPNKNIGDAFLCIWKTEDFAETPRNKHDDAKKSRMRRLSLAPGMGSFLDLSEIPDEYHTKADHALRSFIETIKELRSVRIARGPSAALAC